jgi:hypothetical protein
MKQAAEFCARAADLVAGDREKQHGDKVDNMSNIARLWTAYLQSSGRAVNTVTAEDIPHMMVLMKVARTQTGNFNPDDYIDMAGYAGVGGEVAMRTRPQLSLQEV